MTDQDPATTTPASDAETKPVDAAAQGGEDTGKDTTSQESEDKGKTDKGEEDEFSSMTEEELRKAVKGLRGEIAAKRVEAKTAKAEAAKLLKEKEDAELEKKKKNGEWEKIATEKEAALQKANERAMRAEMRAYAQKEGILDLSDINNVALDGVSMDETTGEIHGAEKVIADLKKAKPHWFKGAEEQKPQSTTSKVSEPAPGKSAPPDYTSMSSEDFAKAEKEYLASVKAKNR